MVIIEIMAFRQGAGLFLIGCFLSILAVKASGQSVTLAWDKNSESDIAGYRIHYGTAAAPDSEVIEVKTTTGIVPNLLTGVTYTFTVTAYNTAWSESAYSQPVSYTVGSTRVIPPAVLANISSRTFVSIGR